MVCTAPASHRQPCRARSGPVLGRPTRLRIRPRGPAPIRSGRGGLPPWEAMRVKVLVVGAGGVGSAFARIAAQRDSFEKVVIADFDGGRAERSAQSAADHFSGVQVDASDESAITDLLRSSGCDAVLNAVDPRFVMPVFGAALAAGTTYVDMAMSISHHAHEH